MYKYTFSGGMCWECPDHRAISSANATDEDWEMMCISFRRRDLTSDVLPAFLHKLADVLGIQWLDYKPRKNMAATGFGRMMAEMIGHPITDEEVESQMQIDPADALFSPIINKDSLLVPVRVHVPDTLWPGAIQWIAQEDSSIAEEHCVSEFCSEFDPAKAHHSKNQDIVVHAPSLICDCFIGALYDWNHGMPEADAIWQAVFAALAKQGKR